LSPLSAVSGKVRTSGGLRNLRRAGVALLALLAGFFLCNKALSPNRNPPDDPPHVVKFEVDPASIESGAPATLRWDVRGATEVVLDQGIGKVGAAASTFEVNPREKTAYLLTATGPGGKVSARASVNVKTGGSGNALRATQLCADAEVRWGAHQAAKATELLAWRR
jgi:hypothetical protein